MRTPIPLEPDSTRFSLSLASPVPRPNAPISRTPCEPNRVCEGYAISLPYFPLAQNLDLSWAWGVGGNTEQIVSLLLPIPGVRVGGKTLVQDEPLQVAVDYGVLFSLGAVMADVGVLWSVPTADAEVYGALRSFFAPSYFPAFSLSLGAAFPSGLNGWYLEISLVNGTGTGSYRDYRVWNIVPGLGYRF